MSELIPVNSSSISHLGYDPESRRLTVKFSNGGTYHYSDVSQEEHDALKSAPSIGKHFQARIKPRFMGTKQK